MYKILIFAILILQSINSFSQSFWKIGNENGDEILLTLVVNNEKNTFEAFTRKDALKDLAGIFTYTLAKAAGKLKYAEIVFIQGQTQRKNDSLLLKGIFNYFDRQYQFSASISGIHFKGKYIDNRNRSHLLTGIKVPDNKPLKDYPTIINAIFSLTEKTLFNSLLLKSDEWLNFKKKVNELKPKISDDYELVAIFYWLGKKLPFSQYEISKIRPNNEHQTRRNIVNLREIKSNLAVFDANSLPENQKEMDSIAAIITKKGYTSLIIDLRRNNRLGLNAAGVLANYLSGKSIAAGAYLTRKWFDRNTIIPKSQDYKKLFSGFTEIVYKSGEFYKEQGSYLNIVPHEKAFIGKVYVLVDSRTSKVAEVLTFVLKNEKIATIVGQKTAGAFEFSEHVTINSEYELNLPVADFYTGEGKSLNKIGIEPNVTVSGEDAMKYVLKLF